MKGLQLIFLVLLIGLFPQQSLATDWTYRFVVWEETMYVVSEEYVTDVEAEIGQVTKYSDMKQYGGNFSNAYEKGTKYYSIKGVDPSKAIAVQVEKDVYLKAESNGAYDYKGRETFHYSFVILAFLGVAGIVIFSLAKGSNKRSRKGL